MSAHRVGALLLVAAALALAGGVQAKGFYLSGSASVYQTSDAIGPGWQGSVGLGYQFNQYLAAQIDGGYGYYYIEDAEGDPKRVDVIPISPSVVLSYPVSIITPFLSLGPTWTWERVAGRDWVNYVGGHAGAGLGIHLGPVTITPSAGYSFYDFGDFGRGSWSYGLSAGVGFGF